MMSKNFDLLDTKLMVIKGKLYTPGLDKFHEIKLIIDTGAATTCFDEEYIMLMNYDLPEKGNIDINTEGGNFLGKTISISQLFILNHKIIDIDSIVFRFSSYLSENCIFGILGMDVLHQFNIHISYSTMIINLEEIINENGIT